MKYKRHQFTHQYYQLWQMGLLLPEPPNCSIYSVKFRKNKLDQYSRVTLRATSVSDALERACYAITYTSPWRPEDIDLHAVYDVEENLLWMDEPFYDIVQKKHEFRGMERREFLSRFGATAAALLYGYFPSKALAGQTTLSLSGTSSGFVLLGEQVYTTAGSFSWTVPLGLSAVSAICIGAGGVGASIGAPSNGRGCGGGGLGWSNNVSVTPGQSYPIVVAAAVQNDSLNGENSYFIATNIVCGYGGKTGVNGGTGGSYTGNGGGAGGNGGSGYPSGGGGAGGYSGGGGSGASGGGSGSGGGAGGNYYYGTTSWTSVPGGVGGSGGGTGGAGYWYWGGTGGAYGGGTGTGGPAGGSWSSMPGAGAVRIIWGSGRTFPSNAA